MKVLGTSHTTSVESVRDDAAIDDTDRIGATGVPLSDIAGGCLTAVGSVLISCVLLLINGAFVMATLAAIAGTGVKWFEHESASQFILFGGPVVLLIVQWIMLDYLRFLWRRRRAD